MEKRTGSGWLRFNAQQNLEELEKSITPRLSERALDPAHISLVRETARGSVADFVRNWLLRKDQWRADRFQAVVVVFEDEVGAADGINGSRSPAPNLQPDL